MEELAKLEAERGMPGYVSAGEGIFADGKKKGNKTGKSGGELCRQMERAAGLPAMRCVRF